MTGAFKGATRVIAMLVEFFVYGYVSNLFAIIPP